MTRQRFAERIHIRVLLQPWAQLLMDLDRASDDEARDLIVMMHALQWKQATCRRHSRHTELGGRRDFWDATTAFVAQILRLAYQPNEASSVQDDDSEASDERECDTGRWTKSQHLRNRGRPHLIDAESIRNELERDGDKPARAL